MDELRSFFGFGTSGPISFSQLQGITAGISTSGPIGFNAFYGKRNLNITSSTLAANLGTVGMSPWGGTWTDPSAQWLWRPGANYMLEDSTRVLFQINYTNTTNANMSGTIYYTADNFVYASHNKVAINGGAVFTGASIGGVWSNLQTATVTLLPGKNLFEFVGYNDATNGANPAGMVFFLIVNSTVVMRSDNVNTLLANSSRTYIGGTSTGAITIT